MKEETTPLVSCIMPTYNRRAFIPHAIQYFLSQDYPQKELIIIDDGSDAIEDLVPVNTAIRYYRLPNKITLGAKLNMACGHARGNIIAHWDDDDWYAPHRLSYQVPFLKKDQVFMAGINHLLFFDLQKKQAFEYRYPPNQRTWLSGSSLCYKKSFWAENPFADINVGMDGLFVWRTTPDHLCVLPDSSFSVHMIHAENGSSKDTSGAWWHPIPVTAIEQLMKEDYPSYSIENIYDLENKTETKPIQASLENSLFVKPSNTSFINVFVCLVHERKDCILDLIRNLQYHDPSSLILLYNGSENTGLLDMAPLPEIPNVFVVPYSQQAKHGYLHKFALECMQFALDHFSFTSLTIVDSDQLLIRGNYSDYINNFFSENPEVGLLSCHPQRISERSSNLYVASEALKEFDLWKPLLESFPGGLSKFVYWTFWPSTVFSAKAVEDLLSLFKENEILKKIMSQTKIWGTEEVILPTLIRLLGYEIALNPCSHEYVKYKVSHTVENIESALKKPTVFWIHPVERIFDNSLRKFVREQSCNYVKNCVDTGPTVKGEFIGQQAILQKITKIEGWLSENEADLLFTTTLKACIDFQNTNCIVEIGSYHGKSTVLLGSVLKQFFPSRKIYSIDPHAGELGVEDKGLLVYPPSFEAFKKNIKEAGVADFVHIIKDYSYNIRWQQPISLLFIDGLHDYKNVARDFRNFEEWVIEGGYIVFHDYADYYPGVQKFVNELLATENFVEIQRADSLFVMQKHNPETFPKMNFLQKKGKDEFPKVIHQS